MGCRNAQGTAKPDAELKDAEFCGSECPAKRNMFTIEAHARHYPSDRTTWKRSVVVALVDEAPEEEPSSPTGKHIREPVPLGAHPGRRDSSCQRVSQDRNRN